MKIIVLRSWQEEYVDCEHEHLNMFQEVREQLNSRRCHGIYGYYGSATNNNVIYFVVEYN
jgi:hypothetical protein